VRASTDLASRLTVLARPGGDRVPRNVLVAACLLALAVGLAAVHRGAVLSGRSRDIHRTFDPTIERYGRLGRLALDVSAPSNEVFDTNDLAGESARSQRARAAFAAVMDSARRDPALRAAGTSATGVRADLDVLAAAMDAMGKDVDRTFASFEVGPPPDAAVIDGHLDRIHETVGRLMRDTEAAEGEQLARLRDGVARDARGSAVALVVLALLVILAGAFALRVDPVAERRSIALLVALGLLAAAMGLDASRRWPGAADRMVERSRARSERLARYADMSRLALAMSAPCNEVFDSGNPEAESARSQKARLRFGAEMDSARRELAPMAPSPAAAAMIVDLEAIRSATDTMLVDVDRTFASFGVGRPPDVATIDGHVIRIHAAVGRLVRHAREAETRELSAPAARGLLPDGLWVALLVLVAAGIGLFSTGRFSRRVEIVESALIAERPSGEPDAEHPARDAERARAEAAVRESEARIRAILEGASDGIVVADERGAITTANPAAERIFGFRTGELMGRHVSELLPETHAAAGADDALSEVEPAPGPFSVNGGTHEMVGLRRDGVCFPLELSVSATEIAGARVWTGIVRDVSTRKQAERVKSRQERYRESLAADASLGEALAELAQMLEEQHAGAMCMILASSGVDRPRVVAAPSMPEDLARELEALEITPWACPWAATLREKARVVVEDTATHPAWSNSRRLARSHGLRSCWCEPIVDDSGRVLGALVTFRRRVHAPGAFEVELGASAAHLAAVALARATPSAVVDADSRDRGAPSRGIAAAFRSVAPMR
jgi:PAS domain S-box-containing protein